MDVQLRPRRSSSVRHSVNGHGVLFIEHVLSAADLRARRQGLALSQAGPAGLLGVTPTAVARWERSEQNIGNPERVAAALRQLETRPSDAARGDAGPRLLPA